MADMTYMTSPTTPVARKAPTTPTHTKAKRPTSGQKRKRKTASEASPTSGQKRKNKNENVSPKNATLKGKGTGARAQPSKKQKVAHEQIGNEMGSELFPTYENQPQPNLPTPYQTPIGSPLPHSCIPQKQQQYMSRPYGPYGPLDIPQVGNYSQQSNSPQIVSQINSAPIDNPGLHTFDVLINTMLLKVPGSLPEAKTDVIDSTRIDQYTYGVWQYCLMNHNAQLHNLANQYGASLPDIKLRALATMNILPSWYFLRIRVALWLSKQPFEVDDWLMETQFKHAAQTVAGIMQRRQAQLAQSSQQSQQGQRVHQVQQGQQDGGMGS